MTLSQIRSRFKAPNGVLFYLLGVYVLLQFGWWAYMLVDLNAEIYQLKLQLLELSGSADPEKLILKGEFDKKLSLRVWMVLGEGAVFMTILLIGFRSVRKSISKELKLAAQQKNFLLSITHELKSPLAAVKLQLQTLNSRDLDQDKQKHLYTRALKDTKRLENLVENLLLVNKVESGKLPLAKTSIHVGEFLSKLLSDHYPDHLASQQLSLVNTNAMEIEADAMALESIMVNLIDNAIKYGQGSNVLVKADSSKENCRISVADQGIGIPESEREKVFERFYRMGNEEVRKTKGTGIGLYLVKLLVEEHEGRISVQSSEPKGTTLVVTLPIKKR
jgi:signal transduction histidine kinase